MTRDDIARMAWEAGARFEHISWVNRDLAPIFERFAVLVAAAEREACAKVCEEWGDDSADPRDIAAAIRARGTND